MDAVVRPADIPEQNWNPGQRGVVLRASPGDPVRASMSGTVHFAGTVAGTPVVSIRHAGGLRTTYEPVAAQVAAGDHVTRGQIIGVLVDTRTLPATARKPPGLAWGAILSSGPNREGYLDPMTLLGSTRVRLLA